MGLEPDFFYIPFCGEQDSKELGMLHIEALIIHPMVNLNVAASTQRSGLKCPGLSIKDEA